MQIKVTLQPEIYKKLKENSKENMRTLSAEINFMLKKAYNMTTTADDDITIATTHTQNSRPKREGDLW